MSLSNKTSLSSSDKANLTEDESKEIRKLYVAGMQIIDIAKKFNRAHGTIHYHTLSEEEREVLLDRLTKKENHGVKE